MDPLGSHLARTQSLIGHMLRVDDAETFSQALGFKAWIVLFKVNKQCQCFTATEEDGSDKRLVEPELACEAGGVAPPDPV